MTPLAQGGDLAAALEAVSVRFGPKVALRDVTLRIEPGAYLEVRGDNGSGKTTLLRVLAGTCPPMEGHRHAVCPIAFVPAAIEPPTMSVGSWLGAIRERRGSVWEALDILGFEGDRGRSFRRLSFGNFRKVLLADALSSNTRLVIIDEAREGLDEVGIVGLDELVERCRDDGVAVVMADQRAHPAPATARVVAMTGGAIVDVPNDAHAESSVTLSFTGPSGRIAELEHRAAALGFQRGTDDA